MKKYKKPIVGWNKATTGIVPLAMAAEGLSVGGAFVVGVASGLMKDGKDITVNLKPIEGCIVKV